MMRDYEEQEWRPRTKLGRLVHSGQITTIHEALYCGLPLRESQLVDKLLPTMEDEVLDVNMVQRMTDSGRRVRFTVTVVVGNSDGYVGLGMAKIREVGPAIRRAIEEAKTNVIEVRRGCGSWECGCGTPHTVPFEVTGRSGSVRVTLKPAPRGIGLAVGDVAKHVLRLAGVKDCWGFTQGKTRTTVNYAKAVYAALAATQDVKVQQRLKDHLAIHTGATTVQGDLAAVATPEGAVAPGAAAAGAGGAQALTGGEAQ